ncbi:MAG: hypothetical protein KC731_04340 [Myxococcales bacterium]|nr:hypothetical protein [Myxococcales bacterium]
MATAAPHVERSSGGMLAPGRVELPRTHRELVRLATLAASSHNTQPWRFRVDETRIDILPDFSRRCSAVDPDDHHLFASLGCAAENLLVAARAIGLVGHITFDPTDGGLRIELEPGAAERSPHVDAIPRRQCARCEYDGRPIARDVLAELEEVARIPGSSLLVLTGKRDIEQVAELVAAGNTAQFRDDAWRRELASWIRFDRREAEARGDGLYGPVMGSPDVPRWLGELFLRFAFSSRAQNRKDIAHIRSSSAILVFLSDHDDPAHWARAGQSYERVALAATAAGLHTAFINQPVEVAPLRRQLATYLGVGDRRPDLVVRIGHGRAMPRSHRRPVEDVLV